MEIQGWDITKSIKLPYEVTIDEVIIISGSIIVLNRGAHLDLFRFVIQSEFNSLKITNVLIFIRKVKVPIISFYCSALYNLCAKKKYGQIISAVRFETAQPIFPFPFCTQQYWGFMLSEEKRWRKCTTVEVLSPPGCTIKAEHFCPGPRQNVLSTDSCIL